MTRKLTPLLSEAVTEYLAVRQTYLATTTHTNERIQLRLFVTGVGDCRVIGLTPEKVERWFATEAKRQQASSFNKALSRVRNFLDFCNKRGWLTADPLGMVRPRKVIKRDRFRLSPEELLDLPKHTPFLRDKTILTLACNTALRAEELRSLRVKDVDLDGGWLRVFVSKSHLEDVMPLSHEAQNALRAWLRYYKRSYGELKADWYLFPSRVRGNGSGPYFMDPEKRIVKMAAIVQRAMDTAGHTVEKGEGIHTLRRSVATAFFHMVSEAGHDQALRMTSALLHHANTAQTENYLGLRHEKLSRDGVMRGRSFLSGICLKPEVVQLGATG